MNKADVLAELLDDACIQAKATAPLSNFHTLTMDEAYKVQHASVARRVTRGERIVGIKMGFTSEAKMRQMGVQDQISGWLTDAMLVKSGASISLEKYIHPRCEPEIAFLLKRTLPGGATEEEAFDALEAVAPAIEIIDSRYEQFKFSLTDVIADNASSAGFVVGDWTQCPASLIGLNVGLLMDGVARQSGSSSDILGNPMRSLVVAARLAAQAGMPLQAGWIVLAGAATAAEPLMPGVDVQAIVERIGAVGFSVTGTSNVHGTEVAQQHLRNILSYLDVPTLDQPEAFIQAKEGLFDSDDNIGTGSKPFTQNWMNHYVAWVKNTPLAPT